MGLFFKKKKCFCCVYYEGRADMCLFDLNNLKKPTHDEIMKRVKCKNYMVGSSKKAIKAQAYRYMNDNYYEYLAMTGSVRECERAADYFEKDIGKMPGAQKKAMRWYLRSKLQNNPKVLCALAKLFALDRVEGFADDEMRAECEQALNDGYTYLLRKTKEGSSEARMQLSTFYFYGVVVEKDTAEAVEMCIRAETMKKDLSACEFIDKIDNDMKRLFGEGLDIFAYTKFDEWENERKAAEARKKYAAEFEELLKDEKNSSNPELTRQIAQRYFLGDEYTNKDELLGVQWYIKAAKKGDQASNTILKQIAQENNRDVSSQAKREAKKYVEEKIRQQEEERKKRIQQAEEKRRQQEEARRKQIQRENKEAFEKASEKAKLGKLSGKIDLAMCYISGIHVGKNVTEGIKLLLEWHKDDKENKEIKAKLWQLFVDENKSQTNEPVLSQWRDFIDEERNRRNEEKRLKKLEEEKRIEEEKQRKIASAKASRAYDIARAKEGSIFCMMNVIKKLLTGSDGLEPDVPFAVELLVDGYWKVVSCLRGELWSAYLDEFYAVFVGDRSNPPMISDSMMWSLPTYLCNNINGVARDLEDRKRRIRENERDAAERAKAKKEWENRKCKDCRYFEVGPEKVLKTIDGSVYEVSVPIKYYCRRLKGYPETSEYGKCDMWEKNPYKTKSEANYH